MRLIASDAGVSSDPIDLLGPFYERTEFWIVLVYLALMIAIGAQLFEIECPVAEFSFHVAEILIDSAGIEDVGTDWYRACFK